MSPLSTCRSLPHATPRAYSADRVAAGSRRVPPRAGGEQRPNLVQGEPRGATTRISSNRRGSSPSRSRTSAPPYFFRPYNDTRFHMRPPLKEHLGVAIGYGGAGGYYVELSLDGLLVAAGLHSPPPDQLGRFRAAIDSRRADRVRARREDRRRRRSRARRSRAEARARAAIRSITRGSTGCG